ncbi:MAG TPA: TetR/AcrR family transcriptional regulator [Solirubrobacteraceae bacterium]|nr:TetR/AcrR family transcriptional regulator [Solirubrobacteraceae bacterium]
MGVRRGEGLGYSHVREIQRRRLLAAAAEVVGERGFALVTVADIVTRAGVSRRTFYEFFEDRTDCFLAAFEDALGFVSGRVVEAYRGEVRWEARIGAALAAVLAFLDEERELGVLCVVHAAGGDPRILARRALILDVLEGAVDEGRAGGRGRGLSPLTAEGVVGAVLSVIHARLLQEDPGAVSPLLGSLMGMIVLPYRGAAAAARELERPAPEVRTQRRVRPADPLEGLGMRLTYRTLRALYVIVEHPGASNREVGDGAGIADQGQTSKLLTRLETLGLIRNTGEGHTKGATNAWVLTARGAEVQGALQTHAER